jgi:hypothetical protein
MASYSALAAARSRTSCSSTRATRKRSAFFCTTSLAASARLAQRGDTSAQAMPCVARELEGEGLVVVAGGRQQRRLAGVKLLARDVARASALHRVEHRGKELSRGVEASCGLLGEGAEHHGVELLRDPPAGRDLARGLGLLREVGHHLVGDGGGGEQPLARQHLPGEGPEAVHVRARVGGRSPGGCPLGRQRRGRCSRAPRGSAASTPGRTPSEPVDAEVHEHARRGPPSRRTSTTWSARMIGCGRGRRRAPCRGPRRAPGAPPWRNSLMCIAPARPRRAERSWPSMCSAAR